MEQGTNTVYNTDNKCCKITKIRYQYCIKNCAKDWHRRRVQRGVNALWSTVVIEEACLECHYY